MRFVTGFCGFIVWVFGWALFALLMGCQTNSIPDEARAPQPDEWEQILDVADRWEERWGLSGDDWVFVNRTRVVDADRDTMLRLCWRDEPGRCAAGEALSKYGCAAGCAIVRSTCTGAVSPWWDCTPYPVLVSSDLLDKEVHLDLLRHEMAHILGGDYGHQDLEVWGPGGVVHP